MALFRRSFKLLNSESELGYPNEPNFNLGFGLEGRCVSVSVGCHDRPFFLNFQGPPGRTYTIWDPWRS